MFSNSERGKRARANINKIKKETWERVGQTIVQNGGVPRHWPKMRKKWSDLAAKARKYRRDCQKTGRPRHRLEIRHAINFKTKCISSELFNKKRMLALIFALLFPKRFLRFVFFAAIC